MIEARSQNNLPMGIMVNQPRSLQPNPNLYLSLCSIPIPTMCGFGNHYLPADIVEVEYCPWDFHLVMSHDGNQVQVSFCPVPMLEVQAEIFSSGVASADSSPNSGDLEYV